MVKKERHCESRKKAGRSNPGFRMIDFLEMLYN